MRFAASPRDSRSSVLPLFKNHFIRVLALSAPWKEGHSG
jgi:hypothetical protein